jgi:hypothetical protein
MIPLCKVTNDNLNTSKNQNEKTEHRNGKGKLDKIFSKSIT